MKKYIIIPAFLMLLGSCCYNTVEDRLVNSKEVHLYISSPSSSSDDYVTVKGLGNNTQNVKVPCYSQNFYISLPLRYKADTCSFVIQWHEKLDTLAFAYNRKAVKYERCNGGKDYEIEFFNKKITKTSLDTTEVYYETIQSGRSVTNIYATYK
jgi:hypothetical protein